MKNKDQAISLGYVLFEVLVFCVGILLWKVNVNEDSFLFTYFGEIVITLAGLGLVLFIYLFAKGINNKIPPASLFGQLAIALFSIVFPFLAMLLILSQGHC